VRDWFNAVAAAELRGTPPVSDAGQVIPAEVYYLRQVYPGRGTPQPGLQTDPWLPMLRRWMRDTLGRDVDRAALFTLVSELRARRFGLTDDGAFALTLEEAAQALGLVSQTAEPRRPSQSTPAERPPKSEEEEAAAMREATDDSAFRPAKEFLDPTRFKTHKRLVAALKAHPWIRTKKPSQQRLLIHAGDWQAFRSGLDSAGFDALDVAAETAEAFMSEVRQRQEEIRQRKAGK
jgi:hypothetical protein